MRKWIAMLLVLCMALALLAGCGKEEAIDTEKAKRIVLEELGLTAAEANPHVHVGEHEGRPCYSVYVTVDGVNMEYKVDSETGEILSVSESSHSH